MDYNTLIVLVGLVSSGLLLGSFGALVSLRGENLTADVAGHGVVSGVVLSQGVTVWLGLGAWLAVPVLWVLGFTSSALILGFIFFLRWRGYSVGASQALAIALAYGSSLVLLSVVQATGAFSTKGLTLLLLGDAATLTLGKVLPALLLLVVWALACRSSTQSCRARRSSRNASAQTTSSNRAGSTFPSVSVAASPSSNSVKPLVENAPVDCTTLSSTRLEP